MRVKEMISQLKVKALLTIILFGCSPQISLASNGTIKEDPNFLIFVLIGSIMEVLFFMWAYRKSEEEKIYTSNSISTDISDSGKSS